MDCCVFLGRRDGEFSLLDLNQARQTCHDFKREFVVVMDRRLLAVVKMLLTPQW